MERTIKGPDWETEYGDAEACAKFVGIKTELWKQLDAADLIVPPAARLTRQNALWHWHSVIVVSLNLIHLTKKLREYHRRHPPEAPPRRRNPKKKLGQTGPNSPGNARNED